MDNSNKQQQTTTITTNTKSYWVHFHWAILACVCPHSLLCQIEPTPTCFNPVCPHSDIFKPQCSDIHPVSPELHTMPDWTYTNPVCVLRNNNQQVKCVCPHRAAVPDWTYTSTQCVSSEITTSAHSEVMLTQCVSPQLLCQILNLTCFNPVHCVLSVCPQWSYCVVSQWSHTSLTSVRSM